MEKQFDIICMGRATVNLYDQQTGARLKDVSSFAKYLDGLPDDMVYGMARQRLRSSMLTRVCDEHMGCFLREELNQVDYDTSHLITDKNRLTALVLLGIKDRDTFPLIFYRDNCANMATTASDVGEQYIASARCPAITGTYLSHPQTRKAVLTAPAYARRHGVRTALDINYHPVPWGLTFSGDGETRLIAVDQVTRQLQEVLHLFDVITDTEEESHIAGGSIDTLQALPQARGTSHMTLVRKRGASGCPVYTDAIPARLNDGLTVTGARVEVLNVLEAGGVFMPGLLYGYLSGEGWERACRYANAYGALVVSRHGCTPAVPSKVGLDDYPSRVAEAPRPDLDPHLNRLHRVMARRRAWPELCVTTFGHHSQLEDMALQCGAFLKRIPASRQLTLQASHETANSAGLEDKVELLCGGTFDQDALDTITGEGWWTGHPIGLPGSRSLGVEHDNIGS